jgi:hypothetical protein
MVEQTSRACGKMQENPANAMWKLELPRVDASGIGYGGSAFA